MNGPPSAVSFET